MRGRVLGIAGYLLYMFVLLEIAARGYWALGYGLPLTAGLQDWYALYFPGLRDSGIAAVELETDDGYFDVLLLGGSVLDNLYDNRADAFRGALSKVTGEPVRLYNLAYPAHTTRDSVLKYRLLRDKPFDLVIVYHGINDTRMNNCPPEMFRDDYGHAAWYHEISRMESHARLFPYLVLPFTAEHAMIRVLGGKHFEFYVARNRPNQAMTRFGSDIRTAASFRKNLEEIVTETGRAETPLLVMTFDWYLPENYSLESFMAGELDYGRHSKEVEIWGNPSDIVAGMEAHNDVVRSFAEDAPGHVIFLDVEPIVPNGRRYWDDICHFSDAGERLWMEAITTALGRDLAQPPLSAIASASQAGGGRGAGSKGRGGAGAATP